MRDVVMACLALVFVVVLVGTISAVAKAGNGLARTCDGVHEQDYCLSAMQGETECDGRVKHWVAAEIAPGPNGEVREGYVIYPMLEARGHTVISVGFKDKLWQKSKHESRVISSDEGKVKVLLMWTPVDTRLTIAEGWFSADGMSLTAGRKCA